MCKVRPKPMAWWVGSCLYHRFTIKTLIKFYYPSSVTYYLIHFVWIDFVSFKSQCESQNIWCVENKYKEHWNKWKLESRLVGKYEPKQSYPHDTGFCSSEDAPSSKARLDILKEITAVCFFRTNVPLGKPLTCICIWGGLLLW